MQNATKNPNRVMAAPARRATHHTQTLTMRLSRTTNYAAD